MRRCNIKKKTATALSYKPEYPAPKILASGQDREAEHILKIAREAGIEIVEDPALAAILNAGAKNGDYIPMWCWEAVAKILAFVFKKEET